MKGDELHGFSVDTELLSVNENSRLPAHEEIERMGRIIERLVQLADNNVSLHLKQGKVVRGLQDDIEGIIGLVKEVSETVSALVKRINGDRDDNWWRDGTPPQED